MQEIATIRDRRNTFYTLAVNPETDVIAAGAKDGSIHMYRGDDWKYIESLGNGHRRRVTRLAFNAAGTRLASAGADRCCVLWSYPEGAPLHRLAGHRRRLTDVTFSPDGTLVATAGADSRVVLWNTEVGWELKTAYGDNRSVWEISFSPDGEYIAATGYGGELVLLGVPSLEPFRVFPEHRIAGWSPTFSPDGSLLATIGFDNRLVIRSTVDWAVYGDLELAGPGPRPLAFSADGQLLACAGGRMITLLDVELMETLGEVQLEARECFDVTFSADERFLLACSSDRCIHVWDLGDVTISE